MKRITFGLAVLLTASLSLTATANIADNFEADHSANYTLVTDTPSDGTANFQFDYVAAGIPLAPNSAPVTPWASLYGKRYRRSSGSPDCFP